MQYITSENNSLIKEIKSLKIKKYRDQKKLYFIEGFKFVEEALSSDEKVNSIIISDIMGKNEKVLELIQKAKQKEFNMNIQLVSDNILRQLSDTEAPQGIIALVKMKDYNLEDITKIESKNNLFIILDAIQDPGNMGTIIRTADAAGFNAVFAAKGCVDFYNPKVLRATMGSIFHIPVIYCDEVSNTINHLKSKGIKIYASHLSSSENYYNLSVSQNIAFIIGNEANGISNQTASFADVLVKIPMPGKAESLNASIAAGILIYETVRQRNILTSREYFPS